MAEVKAVELSMTRERLETLRAELVAQRELLSNSWQQTVGKITLIDSMLQEPPPPTPA